ncbi:hypothetical protein [Dietzia sp. PP-33]|jgi:hypothetical protein|uniref:hypothetical protein n=1 Tax=Dietzia sp. PP-33 TaxID=2957500 RepID=UPI0029B12410|nr:hypothetical protein [Dietzia sp. PP-33]MDX2355981.1 hypothetical protein [Dietzia sp. PP-33]
MTQRTELSHKIDNVVRMVTILAAVISAITAIAVAVVSASRKPPETKIRELQKVLDEVSHSPDEEQIVKRAIAKQFEKLDTPDYSLWLLVWAAVGAVLVTMLSATVSELQYDNAGAVVAVLSWVYLAGFVILLVAAVSSLAHEVFHWR